MFQSDVSAFSIVTSEEDLIFSNSPSGNNSNGSSDSISNQCVKWSLGAKNGDNNGVMDCNSGVRNSPHLENMGLAILANGTANPDMMSLLNRQDPNSIPICESEEVIDVDYVKNGEMIFEQEMISTNDFFVFKKRRIDRNIGEDRINSLVDELMLSIFKWLPKYMLARCAQVCKRWRRLVSSECLWKKLDLGGKLLGPGVAGRIILRGCSMLRLAKAEISGPIFPPRFQNNIVQSKLIYLDLSMAALTPEDLSVLLGHCVLVKKLSLEHCTLNYDCCINISQNPNLSTLNLAMCYGLNGEGLRLIFGKCVGLISVNLAWVNLSSEDLTVVCQSFPSSLCRLNLSGSRKSLFDTHVRSLVRCCPDLLELDLSDSTVITSASIFILLKCAQSLEYLAFSRCYGIKPESYRELRNFSCLMYLDLFGILSDQALSSLRESLSNIKINKYLFSSVARPTVGIRRTSIWGQRVRD